MISKLILNNFKCHKEERFHLNKLTILAGGNASGKSSFIQGLLLLKKSYLDVEKSQLATNDIFGINLGLPENIIAKEHDSEYIYIGCRDNLKLLEVKLKLNDRELNPMTLIIENCEEIIGNNEQKYFSQNNKLAYINAERNGPRITSEINTSNELYVGSRGEFVNYIISKMDKVQKNNLNFTVSPILNLSQIARFSAICEEWLGYIIPGTELKANDYPEHNIADIKFKNGADFYVSTATGFGITYVLPIIVQGLIQSIFEDTIFIVENPEAHLHPYSQSQIGKFLAILSTCGVQVIIETHSEHIINGSRLQLAELNKTDNMSVIFFERKKGEFTQSNIGLNQYGELERWPIGFFDQSKVDLRKLLEKKLCVK